ncbi:spore coat protein [Bacillus inaquosorum]|uniref:spore coat protein n=1 Tax=Bacillus inaquosorum TaxID=483913 RepID=UPI0022818816|nr:spore coat protein [Bacillus inaquosorum]MCY8787751.1 spore coat protein [Bacillus inaquosorum]MCY8843724.1 spore coat protein [Bacillus inaquosorum]MCY9086399.1 spore coat protein [Bacillus inaquosorum]
MESRPYSWVALDPDCDHPREIKEEKKCDKCDGCCNFNGFGFNNDAFIDQDAIQANFNKQISDEVIIIRDSCDVNVTTVDTQAINQVLALTSTFTVAVTAIAINDPILAELVTQDLLQLVTNKQVNRQKLLIENSRCVNVSTVDQDVADLVVAITNTFTVAIAALIIGTPVA